MRVQRSDFSETRPMHKTKAEIVIQTISAFFVRLLK